VKQLEQHLNTKITIKRDSSGKGSLLIGFSDDFTFDKLMDKLSID
jgi:hypothetical protein